MTGRQPPDDSVAIRVPRDVGLVVLELLGRRCGAVLDDPDDDALHWFLPTEAAETWEVAHTDVIEPESLPPLPSLERTQGPGPFWRMCPGESCSTNPDALRAAIADALVRCRSPQTRQVWRDGTGPAGATHTVTIPRAHSG